MALCHALGVPDAALAAGLRAFSGDADANPGRGNLFKKNDIKIFLDFAHNEHGVRAIRDTVKAFDAGRRLVLIGQAGDRSDQDIRDLVSAVCGLEPSRLLVCDMPGYERGRKPWAVAEMIREFAIAEGVPADAVAMFKSPLDGVRQALADARNGDCLVLLAFTQRKEVLATIREFVAGN
jgi:UDP-N-acetylmuramyl tripeptide synthase